MAPPVFADFLDPVNVFPDFHLKAVRVRVVASDGPAREESNRQRRTAGPNDFCVVSSGAEECERGDRGGVRTCSRRRRQESIQAVVSVDGNNYSYSRERIAYPHIGVHILMPPAEAKLVRADIRTAGHMIGYIPGAGDDIPAALRQIGYTVEELVMEISPPKPAPIQCRCSRGRRFRSLGSNRKRGFHS